MQALAAIRAGDEARDVLCGLGDWVALGERSRMEQDRAEAAARQLAEDKVLAEAQQIIARRAAALDQAPSRTE